MEEGTAENNESWVCEYAFRVCETHDFVLYYQHLGSKRFIDISHSIQFYGVM
jgi:hypothetical protein